MKNRLILDINEDEYWWCGVIDLSDQMPFTKETQVRFDMITDPYTHLCVNQLTPLFLSTLNLYVHPNLEQKKKCINQMNRSLK